MRSSNPVFSSLTSSRNRSAYQNPYQQMPYGGQQVQTSDRAMTVDDVIAKTSITLGIIITFAVINFAISTFSPALAVLLTIVGGIGGFITVLVSTFGKKYGSAPVTIIYAVFEGLFVGGVSLLFTGLLGNSLGKNIDAGVMIGQAVLGTIGVFIGMLFVYKTGAVKVTPRFNRILTGCIIGVVVLSVGNVLLYMFTGSNPLTDGGPLAIVFSLVCIVLAALSFLQDFDMADSLVRAGAPSKMAWGVALGLAVTLVWLYTEILRLLGYFRN